MELVLEEETDQKQQRTADAYSQQAVEESRPEHCAWPPAEQVFRGFLGD
jgi:hypothetical protein